MLVNDRWWMMDKNVIFIKIFNLIKMKFSFLLVILFAVQSSAHGQIFKKKQKNTEQPKKEEVKKPKPFKELITKGAKTSKGLFTVHQLSGKWFLEISDSILGREIMSVTRFGKTAAQCGKYGGEEITSQVVKWEKGPNNTLFLKNITHVTYSADSTKPIATAVKNSNVHPIIGAFDILSIRKDTSVVIDVTEYFTGDNVTFGVDGYTKEKLKINQFQKDKSYISSIRTFPINTELKSVKTYEATSFSSQGKSTPVPAGQNAGYLTFELNTSFILLPANPMRKRTFDARVGFFGNELEEYGENSQEASTEAFVTRWRLEPKNAEDAARQANGELIEPKKPIVYYIDPATPVKWRKYIKAGVDDWSAAFEQAGWKNAIRGEYWPENDTTMSMEDARYSVIRYFASDIQNAYGPNVNDPRTGEILESHIGWYHNIMRLLHDWYFIQASPNDPRARGREFDDDLMGKLIQFVSSHEVGHTLGLRHNMGASSATPVEKLRDKNWCTEHGHTSSIMDYARFNYVAQPEDSVKSLFPRIGDYDKWAIEWGYKYFNDTKNEAEDKAKLHLITKEKYNNPRLRFGTEMSRIDPRYQTEDLSDNAMVASTYGIKNLQRIVPNLVEWTKQDGESYVELKTMYAELVQQYITYIGHVSKNIGGIYDTPKTYDMSGDVYAAVPKAVQLSALQFMDKQVFQTPMWLLDQSILSKIKPETGIESIKSIQAFGLSRLLAGDKLVRIIESSVLSKDNMTLNDLFGFLTNKTFSELKTGASIDVYRRNLQRLYVTELEKLMQPATFTVLMSNEPGAMYGMDYKMVDLSTTDAPSVVRANLEEILQNSKTALVTAKDAETKMHLSAVIARVKGILERDYNKVNGVK